MEIAELHVHEAGYWGGADLLFQVVDRSCMFSVEFSVVAVWSRKDYNRNVYRWKRT